MVTCTKQKESKKSTYHFLECGLDYVYLMNGYQIDKDPDFGEMITIYNEQKLHRALARAVLLYRKRIQGQEIRFFRYLLQLTQEQLGNKLGKDRRTVMRWENNESEVSEMADGLLRIIVWEEYLDETRAVRFFEKHKKERTHYKAIEMMEAKNNWQSQLAA